MLAAMEQDKEEPDVIFDPAVGRLVPNPRSSTVESSSTGRTLGPVLFLGWLPGMAAVGLLLFFGYVFTAGDKGASVCGPDGLLGPAWGGGGQASGGSAVTAAILGLVLWLAGGIAVWQVVRRTERDGILILVLSAVGFVGLYLSLLTALWYVSPLIWGPRRC
jgi:hypothetical protein